jgi:hypothetical protein
MGWMEWVYNIWRARRLKKNWSETLTSMHCDGEKYTDPGRGCSINTLKKDGDPGEERSQKAKGRCGDLEHKVSEVIGTKRRTGTPWMDHCNKSRECLRQGKREKLEKTGRGIKRRHAKAQHFIFLMYSHQPINLLIDMIHMTHP